MQGEAELAARPDAQIVVCENAQIAAVVGPQLSTGQIVLTWQADSDDAEAFACLSDRDVICLGFLPMVWITAAKPAKIRTCEDTIPADFTLAWLKTALQPYPPADPELRTVQPYNPESMAQGAMRPSPRGDANSSPLGSSSPPAAVDHAETDLQAILGDSGTEAIGEPPEHVLNGPDDDLNGHDSIPYEASMIWTRAASKGWPEPQNPWGSNEAPKEFDIEHLFPGFMADYGADCSILKGTDKGISATGLLGAFSAWSHESFRMQIKVKDTTWKEHSRTWTFNEGESASGKTPGLNLTLAPAYALNDRAGAEDAHKIAKWLSDRKIRDIQVAEYEKRAAQNKLNAGEQLPPFVDSIEVDNRMFKGANVEGARDKLQTTPKIWLVTQELATWLSSFGRYAPNKSAEGGDRAFWMDSFDGSLQAPELRSGREIQSKASCVITANITGSSLRRMLGNASMEGDGLAQRFIPNHCRLQAQDSDHEQAADPLEAVIRTLDNLRHMRPADGQPLRLHPEGYAYFQEFLKRLHYQTANGFYSPNCKSALTKYQSHAPRIALTLHLAMLAERNQHPGSGEYVSLETMKMACDVCDAWIPHTIYFWENTLSDGGQVDEDVKEVCEVIVCYWLDAETVPLERLLNSWKAGKKRTGQELSRIMADVCGAGWLDDDPMGRRSRRGGELKTSYSVNPKLKRIWDQTEFAINARRRRMETGKKFSEMRGD